MIILSDHAKIKIKQRKLDRIKIIKTINNPDKVLNSYGNRKIVERNFGKLSLRVIYVKEDNEIIIVTAHWRDER